MNDLSERLQILAHINPEIWDLIRQINTRLSEGTRLVMSAMVLKAIAGETVIEQLKPELNRIGTGLFNSGLKSMSYEEDTWYCGTPYPHHLNGSVSLLNAAFPPLNYRRQEQWDRFLDSILQYDTGDYGPSARAHSYLLTSLANAISSKEARAELEQIALKMNAQAEGT